MVTELNAENARDVRDIWRGPLVWFREMEDRLVPVLQTLLYQDVCHCVFELFSTRLAGGSPRIRQAFRHALLGRTVPLHHRELVEASGISLTLSGEGASGMMRRVATEDGTPIITVEMGEANRFQPLLIDLGLQAVENVLAANDMYPGSVARYPEYRKELTTEDEKRWIRASHGGLVEMKWGPLPVVDEGETICVISDHYKQEEHVVEAPFDGFLIGILANPRVLPGHPLVHLVEITEEDREGIQAAYDRVGFARHGTFHWMGRMSAGLVDGLLEEGRPGRASRHQRGNSDRRPAA